MFERILVCTDGSPLSAKAVAAAVKLAALAGAELFALKVVQHYAASFHEGAFPRNFAMHDQLEQGWVDAAHDALAEIEQDARGAGLNVTTLTPISDSIGETIIATARKCDCGLIVMASHGRRGISRLLMGSETQYVLTHSQVPVLVLR